MSFLNGLRKRQGCTGPFINMGFFLQKENVSNLKKRILKHLHTDTVE